MEITVDLDPEIIRLLDYHRATFGIGRADFLNYLIALYDQNTREHHQQVQYQQPSGYIGSVAGLEPVEPLPQNIPPQKQFKLCRDNPAIPRGTRPHTTVIRQKSKTVPRKTARKLR